MQKEVSLVEQKNMGTDAAQEDAIVSCGVQTGSLEDNIAMNMEESDEEKDVFEPEEAEPSVFADVYSDTEDEEEEER